MGKSDLPFYRRPIVQIIGILLLSVIGYTIATAQTGGLWANYFRIRFDLLLFVLLFLLWFVFFVQFILPVRTLRDRMRLLFRIIIYQVPRIKALGLTRLHGPAIFIKDGKIIQKMVKTEGEVKEEIQRRGPGVIWLDPASAAVLRTPVKFTRAVGPGVVFTGWSETIAGVVDLHIQLQFLGPGEGENPFAPKEEGESEEKFKELQDRIRWSTSAMTRDGIEVVATLSVTFKIDADEAHHEGGTPFGFNPAAVFQAVATGGVNPAAKPESSRYHVPWNQIPALIMVDVWREYVRKFTLNQLFETLPADPGHPGEHLTALQFIRDMINERMKSPEVRELDDFGRPTGQKVPSREYALIKASGIKVMRVRLRKVFFASGVEDQLIRQWTANWLETARREFEQVEQRRGLASHTGVEDAQKEFALLAGQEIVRKSPKSSKETLELLMQASRKGIIRNPALYRRLGTELQDIDAIIQWLRESA